LVLAKAKQAGAQPETVLRGMTRRGEPFEARIDES